MPARIPEEIRIQQINALPNIKFLRWADGYQNQKSKAVVKCAIDHYEWSATINNLVDGGWGCPMCSNKIRWTEAQRVEQIKAAGAGLFRFIEWVGKYKNCYSRAVVECLHDGFRWSPTVNTISGGLAGCVRCAGLEPVSAEDRIRHINKSGKMRFIRWHTEYKNVLSRVVVECAKCKFVWSPRSSEIVNDARGCPCCAERGYNPRKTGYLYALRSECGRYVKAGISNNVSRRVAELRRATPFRFDLVEVSRRDGVTIAHEEKRIHAEYESAGFEGFHGATEWLLYSERLMSDIVSVGYRND